MHALPCQLDLGDPFRLEEMPLPRRAHGYGVQWLGRDLLLDAGRLIFLPIRTPALQGSFADYASAASAAQRWWQGQTHDAEPEALPPLAIVPVAYDPISERHILIFGVLPAELSAFEELAYVHA